MKATSAALIGLSILLLTQIIQWKDVLEETAAWDTFIWFSILITFASALNQLGFTTWFSDTIVLYVKGFHWMWGFTALSLVYFYSHYFFVSCAAHIGAMYSCFLIISLALGTPPLLAAMVLGFLSNLMGCLTHYGTGQAPILFAMGTMTTALWWKIGFITSLILIVIWMGIGSLWWKLIGLF
jgi:DASS family divalent anion:Na+ symporter